MVALTGIERGKGQFSRVQVGLSLCKHVQSVWTDHAPGPYELVWWSPRGRQTLRNPQPPPPNAAPPCAHRAPTLSPERAAW